MNQVAAEPIPAVHEPQTLAVLRGALWLRQHWLAFALCSAAVLIPCFWHRHIQAADLGSHLYTAWLTQAVSRGYLPGLHLERQYTNVLVDWLLSTLFPYLGAVGTERTVVAFCVLTFFWGSFAFVSSAAQKPAWSVVPLLAMVSYGAIFHWGFFNFYLSVGFSLFALAIILRGSAKDLLLLPILLALAALAHPMGAACLIALGLYVATLRWFSPRYQIILTLILLAASFAVRAYLVHHFEVLQRETTLYWLLGADQLVVFGHGYLWFGVIALALCAVSIILALREQRLLAISPWLQLYLLVALVVFFAPGGLFDEDTLGMMGYLPDRGSLYSAVALAALVAACRPRRWFAIACATLGIAFFTAIYLDTGALERRDAKVAKLVQPFAGRRIISMIPPIHGSRIHEDHSVDRACIGRCYSYNNYEPSTKQFRLKADSDNRIVEIADEALDAMKDGSYIVKPQDLPLYEVYPCGKGVLDLCISELHASQQNGDVP
jgi:hypothetical protein